MTTKHYYSIGEVCNLLELKAHTIRFWEKEFSVLNPKRTNGSTRHYDLERIELLRTIKDLLYVQGYTVKGVQKKLSSNCRAEKLKAPVSRSLINDELKSRLIEQLSQIRDELHKAGK